MPHPYAVAAGVAGVVTGLAMYARRHPASTVGPFDRPRSVSDMVQEERKGFPDSEFIGFSHHDRHVFDGVYKARGTGAKAPFIDEGSALADATRSAVTTVGGGIEKMASPIKSTFNLPPGEQEIETVAKPGLRLDLSPEELYQQGTDRPHQQQVWGSGKLRGVGGVPIEKATTPPKVEARPSIQLSEEKQRSLGQEISREAEAAKRAIKSGVQKAEEAVTSALIPESKAAQPRHHEYRGNEAVAPQQQGGLIVDRALGGDAFLPHGVKVEETPAQRVAREKEESRIHRAIDRATLEFERKFDAPHEPFPEPSKSQTTATWKAEGHPSKIGKTVFRTSKDDAAEMALGLPPSSTSTGTRDITVAPQRKGEGDVLGRPAAGIVDRVEEKAREAKAEVKHLGAEAKEKGRELKEDIKGVGRAISREGKDIKGDVKESIQGAGRAIQEEGREIKEDVKGAGRAVQREGRELKEDIKRDIRGVDRDITERVRELKEDVRATGRELQMEGRDFVDRARPSSLGRRGGSEIDTTAGGYYGPAEDYSRLSPQEMVAPSPLPEQRGDQRQRYQYKDKFPASSPGYPAEPIRYEPQGYYRGEQQQQQQQLERPGGYYQGGGHQPQRQQPSQWDLRARNERERAREGPIGGYDAQNWEGQESYSARRYTAVPSGSYGVSIGGMTPIEGQQVTPGEPNVPSTLKGKLQSMPKAGAPGSVEGVSTYAPTVLGERDTAPPTRPPSDMRYRGSGGAVGFDASGVYHGANMSLAGPPSEPEARGWQKPSWSQQPRQPQELNPALGDQPRFDLRDSDHDQRAGYYGQRRLDAPHDERGNLMHPPGYYSGHPRAPQQYVDDNENFQWQDTSSINRKQRAGNRGNNYNYADPEALKFSRIPAPHEGSYLMDHTQAEHEYGRALQRQHEMQYQAGGIRAGGGGYGSEAQRLR